MPTYRMDLAYDGSSFFGYAIQKDVRTVQGELERALGPHTGAVVTQVAGRTDKGVHAEAQVVSFVSREIDTEHVLRSLNKQLAPHIAVQRLSEVDEEFHARFSATGRAYRYQILNAEIHQPLRSAVSWHVKAPLDVALMNQACGHLVGEHDFAAFCRRYEERSTTRTLHWACWRRKGDHVELSIGAAAFCHQMVRSVVAFCVAVGTGACDPDSVPDILISRDRNRTKGVAPAHGLTLVAVSYGDDELRRPGWVVE